MRLYGKLPVPLQNLSLSMYGLILQRRYYGSGFSSWCEVYDAQEYFTHDQINQWQVSEVRRLVDLASKYVPYYRDVFRKMGIEAKNVQALLDLRTFPILEKEVVRQNSKRLVDERRKQSDLIQDRTSGSTGTPLVVYWPMDVFPKWWALHERRVRAWAGVSQNTPRAMVGGRPIVPGDSKGPYWRVNAIWRQLYMSSYHISPETASQYIEAMDRYGCQWVTGYGSAISLLGAWLCEHPERNLSMRAIVTSGDNLLPSHRHAIETGFHCRVFDNYGSAEGCLVISECEQGRMHVQPESGVLEILDEHDQPCAPGQLGEMIITGLMNDGMPLIRYRIGDLAAWSNQKDECACGRVSPCISYIEGRSDEYLLMPDGRHIGRLSTAIKKSLSLRAAQIVQDAPNHAWLLISPAKGYEHRDGETVRADIISKIGAFPVDIREVEFLPRTKAGKQRLVVRLFDHPETAEIYKQQLAEIPWRC